MAGFFLGLSSGPQAKEGDAMSDSLPERPDLAQLGRRAKELRDAARRGDPVALERLSRHHPPPAQGKVTLAAAQLVVAREFGFPSWARLKAAVETKLRAGRPNPAPPEEAHWRVSVFVCGVERPLALASRTEPMLEFADSDGRRLASVEADWTTEEMGSRPPPTLTGQLWSPSTGGHLGNRGAMTSSRHRLHPVCSHLAVRRPSEAGHFLGTRPSRSWST